ncbi:hypothetical protein L798_15117 [Zootermopsis nevadensis]|uniref:Uncharacterized protein n=1 Tax=Zootermopsis nevadensis TaxID=136037 RepID=A0A067QP57_ZOONE|nr:hypothetical protein L798_15117 [Zootermopsis nevadensis]
MGPLELSVREAGGDRDADLLRYRGHGQLHQVAEPPGDIPDVPVRGQHCRHHMHLHLGADRQLFFAELPKRDGDDSQSDVACQRRDSG